MSNDRYTPPVSHLLTYGNCSEMDLYNWPDYLALGLNADHIPELIRMATDRNLYQEEVESLESWAPVHAWRALAQLGAEAAIEPLTSLLDEGENDSYWEWIAEELPSVYGAIGSSAIPTLAAYLADTSHRHYSRATAIDSLEAIAKKHPEAREECITILTRQLESATKNESELNSFLVASLIDIQAVESVPAIEAAYAAEMVDEFLVGDWDDVQVALGLKSPDELPKKQPLNLRDLTDIDRSLNDFFSRENKSLGARKADRQAKAKRKMVKESRKKNRKKRK